MPCDIDRARHLVLEWLRADHREPGFLVGENGLEHRSEEIAHCFLKWAKPAGFEFEVVKVSSDHKVAYEVHWTHRGASFVGFKQPPPEATAESALLAGCAALLENQWCRKWLPE